MSYSINLNGHGPDPADVQEAFENAVRALRAVTPEGSSPVGGSLTADGISLSAGDVADIGEPADAGEGDQPDSADPGADEGPAGNPPTDAVTEG